MDGVWVGAQEYISTLLPQHLLHPSSLQPFGIWMEGCCHFHLDPVVHDHERQLAPGAYITGTVLLLPRPAERCRLRQHEQERGDNFCSAGLRHHVLAQVGLRARAEAKSAEHGGRGGNDGGSGDDGRGRSAVQGVARGDALLLEKEPHHVGMTLQHHIYVNSSTMTVRSG